METWTITTWLAIIAIMIAAQIHMKLNFIMMVLGCWLFLLLLPFLFAILHGRAV